MDTEEVPRNSLCAVVIGITARSSSLVVVELPAVFRTPMIVKGMLPISTVSPTGENKPSSSAVVWPRTTTLAFSFISCWVKNEPSAIERPRTDSHAGVDPLTLVVQFSLPATKLVSLVTCGATAAMSGQSILLARSTEF